MGSLDRLAAHVKGVSYGGRRTAHGALRTAYGDGARRTAHGARRLRRALVRRASSPLRRGVLTACS